MDSKRKISTYSAASKLHQKSEESRENDNLEESLDLIEEAIVEYEDEDNFEGVVKAIQSKVLSFKHLFLITNEDKYREFAKDAAEKSLEIAKRHNLTNVYSSCYFRIAEVANLFKDYETAKENFQKSLDEYNGTDAEKGDYRYHLGEALYNLGEKQKGKEEILKGLSEIRKNKNQVDQFLANVWESGALMKLALLLKDENKEEALKYISQAEAIVNSDPRLIIRKRQISEAKKEILN